MSLRIFGRLKKVDCVFCGGRLHLRRIDDLNVVEYQGRCQDCGWWGILRELRCGECHRNRLFSWVGDEWRCTQCGRTRKSSLPREIEKGQKK